MPTWDEIEPIVDRVLELGPAERQSYYERESIADELRAAVEAALGDDDGDDKSFELGIEAMMPDALAELPTEVIELPPQPLRFGAYRVLSELGEGGMGKVYLAERDDGQFEQRVALKVIGSPIFTDEHRARFLQERQILARLQHPAIASLLDGGVTDDGMPFFALEAIDGVPIVQYCDDERLDIDRRIRIFIDVCEAVQYAHRNLVVHRDIKPSNILVTADGKVKLLDFGLAKMLGDSDQNLTPTQGRVMTPRYAAPEQVMGQAITTATDVYGLGVVLYELLVGRPPYQPADDDPLSMAVAIAESEPTPLTLALNEATWAGKPSPDECAQQRDSTLRELRRRLEGDLESVVLKALRKEPAERYLSVEALANDLQHYLDGLPVGALKGRLSHRLAKFVQRNRLPLTSSALLMVSILAGLAATTWQASLATRERDRAREAEARATAINQFLLEDLLRAADPEIAQGREPTISDFLRQAQQRVDTAFRDQPALEAAVRDSLGQTLLGLGKFEQARAQLERALDLQVNTLGVGAATSSTSEARLALLRSREGDYDSALEEIEGVLARQSTALGHSSPEAIESRLIRAQILQGKSEYVAAERELRAALDDLGDSDDAWRLELRLLNELARALEHQRKMTEAEQLSMRIVELQRERLGPDHPDLAEAMTNLAANQRRMSKDEEALDNLEQALDLRRRVLGKEHPDTLSSLRELGRLHIRLDRFDRAEPVFREQLAGMTSLFGDSHPQVGRAYENLAIANAGQDEVVDAERYYRRAYEVYRRSLGEDHHYTFRCARNLTNFLFLAGRDEAAREMGQLMLESGLRTTSREEVDLTFLNDFAYLLVTIRPAELRRPLRALAMMRRVNSELDEPWLDAIATDATVYYELGDTERGIALMKRALQMPDSVHATRNERVLIEWLSSKEREREAESVARSMLERRVQVRGDADPLVSVSRLRIGQSLNRQGRFTAAEEQLRSALVRFEQSYSARHEWVCEAHSSLAEALIGQSRLDEAAEQLQASARGLERNFRSRERPGDELVRVRALLDQARSGDGPAAATSP